jgi:molybdopterin biosynthesis enzyme
MTETVYQPRRRKSGGETHLSTPSCSQVGKHGLISVEEALTTILARARPVSTTGDVALMDALGRVLEREADGSARVKISPNQSSGVLSSAAWCNGLAVVPEGRRIAPGQQIEFILLTELLN